MLTQNYYQHSPVQSTYYYPTQYSCQPIDMQRFETRFNNYRLLNSITPFARKPSPPKPSPPPSAIKQKQKNTSNGKNDKHEKPLQKNYQHEQNFRTTSVIMKVEAQKILKISTNDIKLNIDNLDDVEDEIICKWENCYKVVLTLDELASHVTQNHAVATKDGLYNCKWEACPRSDRGFNARYKMLVHVRTHTKEKPHQCLQCDKSFSRAENLKIHVRSHSGEKPYICPVFGCNKAYSNSSDRFKHTRTHSTEKPYICKVNGCNKKYTDPSSLRKHVKTFKHGTKTLDIETPTENCITNMNGFSIPHHQQSPLSQKSSSPLLPALSQQSSSPSSSSEFNKYYANEINVLEIIHSNEKYYAKVEDQQQQPHQQIFVDTNTKNLKCNCAIEYLHKPSYPDDTNDFLKFDQLSSKLDVINLHVHNDGGSSEQNKRNFIQDNVKIKNIIDMKIENEYTDSPLDLSIHKRYYHYQHIK